MSDKTVLDNWRKRVGDEEANKIAARSARRGTAMHNMCEKFVLNESIDFKKEMPFNVSLFRQVEKVLNENVNDIRAVECQLFSHKLKVAGTCDLIASYGGKLATIDFKTSIKAKRREWIENYFYQTAMYSYMLYEMTGLIHPKLVVIIGIEEENYAQVFEDDVRNYLPGAKSLCIKYHDNF